MLGTAADADTPYSLYMYIVAGITGITGIIGILLPQDPYMGLEYSK